jgi:hypothetical protein
MRQHYKLQSKKMKVKCLSKDGKRCLKGKAAMKSCKSLNYCLKLIKRIRRWGKNQKSKNLRNSRKLKDPNILKILKNKIKIQKKQKKQKNLKVTKFISIQKNAEDATT